MRLSLTFSLLYIAVWWIFTLLFLPGTMHTLARFSYGVRGEQQSWTEVRGRALDYATRGGDGGADIFFTTDEVAHLLDVQRLYLLCSRILNTFSVFSWTVLVYAVAARYDLRPSLRDSARILGLMVVLLTGCMLFFSRFFLYFHEILFPQGNWSFPADSLLIQVFPEAFWRLSLMLILSLVAVKALLYWVISKSLTWYGHT